MAVHEVQLNSRVRKHCFYSVSRLYTRISLGGYHE